jgi:hypothetical protein
MLSARAGPFGEAWEDTGPAGADQPGLCIEKSLDPQRSFLGCMLPSRAGAGSERGFSTGRAPPRGGAAEKTSARQANLPG